MTDERDKEKDDAEDKERDDVSSPAEEVNLDEVNLDDLEDQERPASACNIV
jgi:hypothetical protein